MSKRIFVIALAVIMLLMVGCQPTEGGANGGPENGGAQNRGDGFVLKAVVKAVHSDYIEAEVIESDYAFGVYWVRTGNQTTYGHADGTAADRADIKSGQTINITYSGQTMMSFPPQIVAWSITIL